MCRDVARGVEGDGGGWGTVCGAASGADVEDGFGWVGADGSCGEAERFFGLDGEFEVLTGGFCLDDPELLGFWAGCVDVEGGLCVKELGEGDAGDEGSCEVHGGWGVVTVDEGLPQSILFNACTMGATRRAFVRG